MVKAMQLLKPDGSHSGWIVFCPGCETGHEFDARWSYNGNAEAPTFQASMLVYGHKSTAPFKDQPRCHSYVKDGKIQFLDDTEHALRGKTVDLPDFDTMGGNDAQP